MKEFKWYDGMDVSYPRKENFTFINVYHHGEVLGKEIPKPAFIRGEFHQNAIIEVVFNDEEYTLARKAAEIEVRMRRDQFKIDLFKEFGVTENPKAELCYQLSVEYGGSAHNEIYDTFSELVRLIED